MTQKSGPLADARGSERSGPRPSGRGVVVACFAAIFAYTWACIDPRFMHYWQGPVFYMDPGFAAEFLRYPGGPADYLYGLLAQCYASRTWGALLFTAELAAAWHLTGVLFRRLGGRSVPLIQYASVLLLLYHAGLCYDGTPIRLAIAAGSIAGIAFVAVTRRSQSLLLLFPVFLCILAVAYYLAGMAMVFFAQVAAAGLSLRRSRTAALLAGGVLIAAAALPMGVERSGLIYVPSSAATWFTTPDVRRQVVCWGLCAVYAAGVALALRRPGTVSQDTAAGKKSGGAAKLSRALGRLPGFVGAALLFLTLAGVAALSHRLNARDRRLAALSYHTYTANWPAALETARRLESGEFNLLSRYQVNLALHETSRLGDDMFSFPQSGPVLLDLRVNTFLSYMLTLTDMCLRLGRISEAERFGSEVLVAARGDPRVHRLMAQIEMVKGQTDAARKFLTVLSYAPGHAGWARRQIRELDQDPALAGNQTVQQLRRRMLRTDDMLPVWQRASGKGLDLERLLLSQLEQDPGNRMAFEFLMGTYLQSGNLQGARALMPRMVNLTGPAYVAPDGRRRTPYHYQEAMAIYSDALGKPELLPGVEIEPETLRRMALFKSIVSQAGGGEAARRAVGNEFRNSYFYYFMFGHGGSR